MTKDQWISATVCALAVLVAVVVAWKRTPLPALRRSATGTPVLTIGDHLKRTRAYFQRIMVPVVCGWIAVVTLFGAPIPRPQRDILSIGGGLTLFVVGLPILMRRLRCPRCGTNFNRERIAKFGRWTFDTRGTEELWDACPHCGVSFTDPYPR